MHQGLWREMLCKVCVFWWSWCMLSLTGSTQAKPMNMCIVITRPADVGCNKGNTVCPEFCTQGFPLLDNHFVMRSEKSLQATHTLVSVCISSNSHHAFSCLALHNLLTCSVRLRANSIVWEKGTQHAFLFVFADFSLGLKESRTFFKTTVENMDCKNLTLLTVHPPPPILHQSLCCLHLTQLIYLLAISSFLLHSINFLLLLAMY